MNLSFVRNQRGLDFVKRGMRVELSYGYVKKQGCVKSGNCSGNLNILFDGEKKSVNCHPKWAMTYFDQSGNIIAKYPD
ncbi:MAG: hypothetical protein IPL70_09070 [Uliginosibacterium sp.]|nr:hypothetical protein [Uliginosibacterium sp.]